METENFNLYDKDTKLEFLNDPSNDYNDSTKITYLYQFDKFTRTEQTFNKSLHEFNIDEVEILMHDMNFINKDAAIRTYTLVRNYFEWAIKKGLMPTNISPLIAVPPEWIEKFVSKKKQYFTKDELKAITDDMVNLQDRLPIWLAFEGILGEDMSEQSNLKLEDCETNTVKVTETIDEVDTTREVVISNYLYDLIQRSATEIIYLSKNGVSTSTVRPESYLHNTPYVLKGVSRKKETSFKDVKVDKFVLYRRLRLIKEFTDAPLLSYKGVYRSGQLYYAYQLYEKFGKLDGEHIDMIGERFNIKKIKADNGEMVHQRGAIRKYVNRKNLLDLYGIDIDIDLSEENDKAI